MEALIDKWEKHILMTQEQVKHVFAWNIWQAKSNFLASQPVGSTIGQIGC